MTAEMRSLEPSDKYDNAQQASVRTSTSTDEISVAKVGSAGVTHSRGGGGFPLQRFESVHVAFRKSDGLPVSPTILIIGFRPPLCKTKSRKLGQSPAMLPSAQTACSRTSSSGEISSSTNRGSAPCSTTTRVWSAVPEAMLVSTHAASNWRLGLLTSLRSWTKRGTMPALMT